MNHQYTLLWFSLLIVGSLCKDCSNLNEEYVCSEGQHEYPTTWDERSFQTPQRGDENYRDTYQDMNLLVGYVQIKYMDKDTAIVTFKASVNSRYIPDHPEIIYTFGGADHYSESIRVTSNDKYPEGMTISARIDGLAKLDLEKIYFWWDNPEVIQPESYENGQKGAIVEFFGWPYEDVEQECEFLGAAGYMAAKVFPPQEAILTFDTVENGELNPWWFLYQPVSYRLHSRHGTKEQFKSLIDTCRSKGVRIYADAVINHMTGNGNDMYPDHRNKVNETCVHWGPKAGSAGSPWYTTGGQYADNYVTGIRPGVEFPSVPYTASDFHCFRAIESASDADDLNYGWLYGLTDLNTEKEYVRQRIADYLTDLISMGVSGIRVDAAKYIGPESLSQIFAKLKENLGGELPEDFIAYLEVLYEEDKDLLLCGDGDYSFGKNFEIMLVNAGLSVDDLKKIKLWGYDYPNKFPICGKLPIKAERFAIGLECHDDQFPGSSGRDMGEEGSVYIKEKNVAKHRNFTVKMFSRKDYDWKIKLVLSSYSIMDNGAVGFPDGNSDCSMCASEECETKCTKSVPYKKAFDPVSRGYDTHEKKNWKEGSYTRVHRDFEIVVAMRKWMGLSELTEAELYGAEEQLIEIQE